jgi:hypothetical protein
MKAADRTAAVVAAGILLQAAITADEGHDPSLKPLQFGCMSWSGYFFHIVSTTRNCAWPLIMRA